MLPRVPAARMTTCARIVKMSLYITVFETAVRRNRIFHFGSFGTSLGSILSTVAPVYSLAPRLLARGRAFIASVFLDPTLHPVTQFPHPTQALCWMPTLLTPSRCVTVMGAGRQTSPRLSARVCNAPNF